MLPHRASFSEGGGLVPQSPIIPFLRTWAKHGLDARPMLNCLGICRTQDRSLKSVVTSDDAILCQIDRVMPIRHSITRAARIGACFGLLLSLLVLAYGYLEPHIHAPAVNDWLIFIACPSSITLMAADSAGRYLLVFAALVVIVINALWYAFLFEVGSAILQRIGR